MRKRPLEGGARRSVLGFVVAGSQISTRFGEEPRHRVRNETMDDLIEKLPQFRPADSLYALQSVRVRARNGFWAGNR